MESAAPQTPVQALEALQNAYSRFLDALPEARRASLGEAIGFFLRSDGNPKLGSLVDAFAEELPVHVEALKTRLAACPAEEADRLAAQALERLRLPGRVREEAVDLVARHHLPVEPTRKWAGRWLSRLGEERLLGLLLERWKGGVRT